MNLREFVKALDHNPSLVKTLIRPLGIRQVLLHEIFHDFVRQYGGIHREDTIDGIAKGLAMNLNYGFIRKLYKLEREIELR